jgi:hypothetical protein
MGIPAAWLSLTIVGLGLGAAFHRGVAGAFAPSVGAGWRLWLSTIGLAALIDVGIVAVAAVTLVAAATAALLLPLFGVGVLFVGFSLTFWAAIYLFFTPHGMVRFRLGLFQAMRESVELVRWNLLGTTGLLAVLLAVDRLAGLVWLLPDPATWFTGLAVLGHAFVSAVLIAASYAFYGGRREWWQTMRQLALTPPVSTG